MNEPLSVEELIEHLRRQFVDELMDQGFAPEDAVCSAEPLVTIAIAALQPPSLKGDERVKVLEELLQRIITHPGTTLCECGNPGCLTYDIRAALTHRETPS